MSPERSVPVLPVDDLEAARRFYVDRLGFEVDFEATADGHAGLLGLRRGSIEITLDCPMAGHGRDACVSLRVDDADRYYEEWRQRVTLRRPPRDEDWGGRTFDLQDPFGNTIFVIGALGGPRGGDRSGKVGTRTVRLVAPRYVLAVPDLARSAAYFRDVLGFTVHEIGDPGWRWLERGACVVLAGECPDAIAPSDLGDHSYFAYIEVDDVDALSLELTGHGVEVIKSPRTEPWGMREFGIRTIDGHRIMFGARAAAQRQERGSSSRKIRIDECPGCEDRHPSEPGGPK
jgi:catechol 2,3-dioxygenase-like lactoylglutathione lyase family enzyme